MASLEIVMLGLPVELPAGFVSSTTASIGETMDGLWPVVVFVVAIPFAFYVLNKIRALATQGVRGRTKGY